MFAKFFQQLTFWPTYLFVISAFRFSVCGQENLSGLENKGVIFASNHCNFLDGPFCGMAMPREPLVPKNFCPLRFLAAKQYMNWVLNPIPFPFSLFTSVYIRFQGSIPIIQGKTDMTIGKKLAPVVEVLNEGGKIWIFPEGQRNKDGKISQGKRGVAYLHKASGAPIVPAALIGTSGLRLWHMFFIRPKVVVVFGKPIYNFNNSNALEENTDSVMDKIKELFNSL